MKCNATSIGMPRCNHWVCTRGGWQRSCRTKTLARVFVATWSRRQSANLVSSIEQRSLRVWTQRENARRDSVILFHSTRRALDPLEATRENRIHGLHRVPTFVHGWLTPKFPLVQCNIHSVFRYLRFWRLYNERSISRKVQECLSTHHRKKSIFW